MCSIYSAETGIYRNDYVNNIVANGVFRMGDLE